MTEHVVNRQTPADRCRIAALDGLPPCVQPHARALPRGVATFVAATFVAATLFSIALFGGGDSARADGPSLGSPVTAEQLVGEWTGTLRARLEQQNVDGPIDMHFKADGSVRIVGDAPDKAEVLLWNIDGRTVELRRKKGGNEQLLIVIHELSADRLSGRLHTSADPEVQKREHLTLAMTRGKRARPAKVPPRPKPGAKP